MTRCWEEVERSSKLRGAWYKSVWMECIKGKVGGTKWQRKEVPPSALNGASETKKRVLVRSIRPHEVFPIPRGEFVRIPDPCCEELCRSNIKCIRSDIQ